jgi:hypothetical protein
VFLIGEESLLLGREGDVDRDPDPTIAIEGLGGRSSHRTRSPRLPVTVRGARGLALFGLAVGAALLAALGPWGGGGPDRPAHAASPRTPLISRSAAALPPAQTARVHRPAARAADVPPQGVHHQRSRRVKAPAPPRPEVTQSESEREPTPQAAPVSSPAVTTTTEAAPEPEPAPAPTAIQMPSSPPPSSSGGGPGGVGSPPPSQTVAPPTVETFGFER